MGKVKEYLLDIIELIDLIKENPSNKKALIKKKDKMLKDFGLTEHELLALFVFPPELI